MVDWQGTQTGKVALDLARLNSESSGQNVVYLEESGSLLILVKIALSAGDLPLLYSLRESSLPP